jgi:hypothetical protein
MTRQFLSKLQLTTTPYFTQDNKRRQISPPLEIQAYEFNIVNQNKFTSQEFIVPSIQIQCAEFEHIDNWISSDNLRSQLKNLLINIETLKLKSVDIYTDGSLQNQNCMKNRLS